jgi:hypothetical protein
MQYFIDYKILLQYLQSRGDGREEACSGIFSETWTAQVSRCGLDRLLNSRFRGIASTTSRSIGGMKKLWEIGRPVADGWPGRVEDWARDLPMIGF